MPINTTIISQEFFNKSRNGDLLNENTSDFTQNLVSNPMEVQLVRSTIDISWIALASISDTWEVSKPTATTFIVTRSTGSFLNDGFWNGAVCEFKRKAVSSPISSDFTITSISQDGKQINATSSANAFNGGEWDDLELRPIASDSSNQLTAIIYGFNIIGNNEQYNKQNKVTGNTQEWYATELSAVTVDGKARGTYNDWVTGSFRVDKLTVSDIATQRFVLYHEFSLLPYYTEGDLNDLQNGITPEPFADGSLKYAFDIDVRTGLNNENKSIKAVYDKSLGSVGWFNQNFSGFDNDYLIESIVYEDADTADSLDGLQIIGKTKATITISKAGGIIPSGQRAGLYVSYLPPSDEYTNTVSDFDTNFMFDDLYHNEGDAESTGAGVIKSVNSSIVSDKLVLVAELECSSDQKQRLTSDSNYIIAINIEDGTITNADNSNRVMLLADVNNYQQGSILTDIVIVDSFKYLVYGNEVGLDTGVDSIEEAWNEDCILVDGSFSIDLAREGFLNSITFLLAAYNEVEDSYFKLDEYNLNVSGAIVSGGSQQIELLDSRGYQGLAFDDFNQVSITTGNKTGNLQAYDFKIGQRLRWQDWQFNPDVDRDFYDATKEQDNLNFKASNYSGNNGYEIKVIAIFNSTGIDEIGRSGIGQDVFIGGDIVVKDYGESDTSYPTALITTKDPDTLSDLNGSILPDSNTLLESRFTYVGTGVGNQLVIHRYEETLQPGGVLREVATDLSIDSNVLVAQSILDPSLFGEGQSYNFTSRLFNPFVEFVFLTSWNTTTDGAFNPTVTSTLPITFIFGDDVVVGGNPNYSGDYLDGTIKEVKISSSDFNTVSELLFDSFKIEGEIDLSLFLGVNNVSFRNDNLVGFVFDTTVEKTLTEFDFIGNDFPEDYEIDLNEYQIIHDGDILISEMKFDRFKAGQGQSSRIQCYLDGANSIRVLDLTTCNVVGDLQINFEIAVLHRIDTLLFKETGNSGGSLFCVNTSLSSLDFAFCPFSTYDVGRNSIATSLILGTDAHTLIELEAAVCTALQSFDIGGAIVNSSSTAIRFRSSSLDSALIDSIYNQIESAYDGVSDLSGLTIDTSFNDSPTAASTTARNNLASAGATIII